jgi:hypothetical protein
MGPNHRLRTHTLQMSESAMNMDISSETALSTPPPRQQQKKNQRMDLPRFRITEGNRRRNPPPTMEGKPQHQLLRSPKQPPRGRRGGEPPQGRGERAQQQ